LVFGLLELGFGFGRLELAMGAPQEVQQTGVDGRGGFVFGR